MNEKFNLARSEFGVRLARVGTAWRQQVDGEFKRQGGLTASKWRPLFWLDRLGEGVRIVHGLWDAPSPIHRETNGKSLELF